MRTSEIDLRALNADDLTDLAENLLRELATRLATCTRWIDFHDAPLDGEPIMIYVPPFDGPFGRVSAKYFVARYAADASPDPCWVQDAGGSTYTDTGLRKIGAMWLPLPQPPST